MNRVILMGRLTRDPEVRYTQGERSMAVARYTLAVDRRGRRNQDGNEQTADFINIVAWRNTAEFVAKYFKKGNMIGIEGSIQTRKYTDKDGNNRVAFEVLAGNVQFVESKRSNTDVNIANDSEDPLKAVSENLQNAGFEQANMSDDDLPF